MTDRKGQITTYSYFKDDALQQKTYTNASVTTPSVSFTYDAVLPRVSTMVDGTGTTTYSYYPISSGQLGAGQLETVDGPLASDTITYTYDELGRVASRDINGTTQAVTYDAIGRTTGVTNALGAFAYGYVGNSGRVASLAYPNGQTSTYTYFGHTGDDRLQTILHARADTTPISRFDYTYDPVGNLASWSRQTDANPATAYGFAYDAADQVVGATKQTTDPMPTVLTRYRYAYDPAGNRTSEQIDDAVTGATYNSANELVSTQPSGGVYFAGSVSEPSVVTVGTVPAVVAPDNTFGATVPITSGTNTVAITARDPSGNTTNQTYQVASSGSTTSFTYDANGNLTSDGTRSLTWDAEDRLITVTIGTHVSTFSYDGLDRRVEILESDSGSTTSDTKFVWCALMLCEARDASTGVVLKRYFDEGVQDSGSAYFYTRDHLGSVRELMDGTNTVRARYDYDPWGRRTKISGDKDTEFGFTGHYQHVSGGLLLAPARAYDPNLGRWISEDPGGMIDGANMYGYVHENPVGALDPFGLCQDPDDAGYDKVGGSRSWRNNNPGNLGYGRFARTHGATGSDQQGFAIFQTEEVGTQAQDSLWHTLTYQNLTIDEAARRWTSGDPVNIQNTYSAALSIGANVGADTKVSDLTPSQLQGLETAQRAQEGWRQGTIVPR